MEAFNVYMEITKFGGNKLTLEMKTYAATGWEAFSKMNGVIRGTTNDVIQVKLIRWEILNPFQVHFQKH